MDCLCPSRFFVEEGVRERFTTRFVEHARALRVGDGTAPATQMGPLANATRLEAISRLVEDARARGATVLTGGNRVGTRGYFYAPTVLADVPDDAAILHEEPFGPVAPIIPFTDETDMLRLALLLGASLRFWSECNCARQLIDLHSRTEMEDAG